MVTNHWLVTIKPFDDQMNQHLPSMIRVRKRFNKFIKIIMNFKPSHFIRIDVMSGVIDDCTAEKKLFSMHSSKIT